MVRTKMRIPVSLGWLVYTSMLVCLLARNLPPPDFPIYSRALPSMQPTKFLESGPHLPDFMPSTLTQGYHPQHHIRALPYKSVYSRTHI
jgi:hypothetical protein